MFNTSGSLMALESESQVERIALWDTVFNAVYSLYWQKILVKRVSHLNVLWLNSEKQTSMLLLLFQSYLLWDYASMLFQIHTISQTYLFSRQFLVYTVQYKQHTSIVCLENLFGNNY